MKKIYTMFMSIVLVAVIMGPIFINEIYKFPIGYKTAWGPIDLLSYYGAALSFIGTAYLGLITVMQTKKANDISNRLLSIEESNSNFRMMPVLKLQSVHRGSFDGGCSIRDNLLHYYTDEVDIGFGGDSHVKFNRFLRFRFKNVSDVLSLDIKLENLLFNQQELFIQHLGSSNPFINILKPEMDMDIVLLFDEKLFEKTICSVERSLTFSVTMRNIYDFQYKETITFNFKLRSIKPRYEEMVGPEIFESTYMVEKLLSNKM